MAGPAPGYPLAGDAWDALARGAGMSAPRLFATVFGLGLDGKPLSERVEIVNGSIMTRNEFKIVYTDRTVFEEVRVETGRPRFTTVH